MNPPFICFMLQRRYTPLAALKRLFDCLNHCIFLLLQKKYNLVILRCKKYFLREQFLTSEKNIYFSAKNLN